MRIKSFSDQELKSLAFEKQVISLCEEALSVISEVSSIFLNSSVTFLSGLTPANLRAVLKSLLPYEKKSSDLESAAKQIKGKFEEGSVTSYPIRNVYLCVHNLYENSSLIPGWEFNVSVLTEGVDDVSVDKLVSTIKSTISNIFNTFNIINDLVGPIKNQRNDIPTLPVSLQECPKVVSSDIQ